MDNITIDAKDLIGPAFYDLWHDVQEGGHTYYDLYGGRGSLKSSFVSIMIPLGMMQDPEANAICFRKVGRDIGTSIFEQMLWGIDQLGCAELWKATTSPHKITYLPTGQVILFRGLDKWTKTKSIKLKKGYFKFAWFEELDEFAGEEEIRGVQQSILRGGDKFVVFKSFNPPISKANWANQYILTPRQDALRHRSNYLDAPKAWLGEQFLADAEHLKEVNPKAYEHEYMGVPTGTGGEVFDNLEIREITDEEAKTFDRIYMGIDWGWYPDPYHWGKMHFDAARRKLYIFDEYRANKTSNKETWQYLVKEKGVTGDDLITADSAEPKSVSDYKSYGAYCRGAIKGADSVRYGMKWLQSLNAIVIDPIRCPHTAKEFSNYEYERTAQGEVMSGYPDADNHAIDMTRYALESIWRRRGK